MRLENSAPEAASVGSRADVSVLHGLTEVPLRELGEGAGDGQRVGAGAVDVSGELRAAVLHQDDAEPHS